MRTRQTVFAVAAMLAFSFANASPPVQATLTLGNNTQGIASDPSLDKVFITNFDSGTVSVVDMNALTLLATIPVGANPRRIAVDAATHRVYVTNSIAAGTVTVINAQTNAVVATIPVGNDPRGVGSNFFINEVYVSNNAGSSVSVISAATNAVVATIPVGVNPLAPASNDILDKLYVVNSGSNTVSVIDEHTLAVIKTIAVGNGPGTAAVDAQHGKVYVNNVTDKTISVINSATDTVTATIPGGATSSSNFGVVSAVYHRYYLPNAVDNTVTIVNTDTDTVTNTVTVGATPFDLIVDSNGGNIYVVNQGSNSLTILNAGTETVIDNLAVGGAPWRMIDGLDHIFVLNTNGANPDSVTIAAEENTLANTAIATEFYEAAFDHYFHTADEVETRLLVDGVFGDAWHRTFVFWRVWTSPGPGRVPVCRFFSASFAPKSSHFYTPIASECQTLQTDPTLSAVWQLEDTAVFYMELTDAGGNCAANTSPLYRVYNNGMGGAPNHRYTPDRSIRDHMITLGWSAEGQGPDTIFACIPTLLSG